jgi:NAD(P)-dependent dehydrogenase (short-subunit alcohol dehydrogenase family)
MPQQIALITGATSGIGRAAAAQLAAAGWTVWVAGRGSERAEATAAQVGGRPLQLDVTDPASVAAAAAAVTRLDVLVNNAGISPDYSVPLVDADAELFRRTYETNVFGVVVVTNAFLPALRRSTHPRIVNVSSGTSSLTWSSGPNPQFDYQQAAGSSGRLAAYRSRKRR